EYQGRFLDDASERGVRAPRAGRRRFRLRGQAFGPGGIGCGHPCSFEREDFHHSFLDETGGRASRERRSRREGRREIAHLTPERDSAIACGGTFGDLLRAILRFPRELSNSTSTK